MKSNASKIKLTSYDDLFKTDEQRADDAREKVMEISLSEIHDFKDHPYQVKDDEHMQELVESIQSRGLIHSVLVRPDKEKGGYEMIAGHRRKRAFELAGIEKIPAIVREISKDDAILVMVDSNLQREEILPSEKAFAYKMRMDAMKRQGMRTDLSSCPVGTKLENGRSDKLMAEEVGDSARQIQRFIRLTELIPELLVMVDEKKLGFRPAVEISYLTKEEQTKLLDAMEYEDASPTLSQAMKMKKFSQEGNLNPSVIDSIMQEDRTIQKVKSNFRDKRIVKLIPASVPKEQESDYVVKALEFYNRYLEKRRDREER